MDGIWMFVASFQETGKRMTREGQEKDKEKEPVGSCFECMLLNM